MISTRLAVSILVALNAALALDCASAQIMSTVTEWNYNNNTVGTNTSPTPSTNQSYGYASRLAARYNGNTILTFVDGHVAEFPGSSVVDPTTGKAFFAPYPSPFPAGAATIYWEMLPTATPN